MNKKTQNTINWIALQNLYNKYEVVINNGLTDFSKNAPTPQYSSIIYQNILQRIYFGIRTTEILLKLLNQSYFKFSIAIQLRSSILDSMIAVYLSDFANDDTILKKQIANLSHQTAKNINTEIEKKCADGLMTADQRGKQFETLSNIFPGNFDLNGKKMFNSNYTNIGAYTIVKDYCKSTNTNSGQKKWMEECYELYKHFSIYEHYNALSKTLLEHELAFDYDLNKFVYSAKFIFDASITCLTAMNDNGKYIKQIEELILQWKKLEPSEF